MDGDARQPRADPLDHARILPLEQPASQQNLDLATVEREPADRSTGERHHLVS